MINIGTKIYLTGLCITPKYPKNFIKICLKLLIYTANSQFSPLC